MVSLRELYELKSQDKILHPIQWNLNRKNTSFLGNGFSRYMVSCCCYRHRYFGARCRPVIVTVVTLTLLRCIGRGSVSMLWKDLVSWLVSRYVCVLQIIQKTPVRFQWIPRGIRLMYQRGPSLLTFQSSTKISFGKISMMTAFRSFFMRSTICSLITCIIIFLASYGWEFSFYESCSPQFQEYKKVSNVYWLFFISKVFDKQRWSTGRCYWL